MDKKFEEYDKLIEKVLNLKQKLFQAFEAEIEIAFDPGLLELENYKKLKDVLKPGRLVSEILHIWPIDVEIIPLVVWTKPRNGIFHYEGQNWFFAIHGFLEVRFYGLPSELEDSVLQRLKAGEIGVLRDLPECRPVLSAAYLRNGRTDGISDQLMYDFAQSIGSKFAELSEKDHEELLKEMVQKGIL